MFGYSFSGFLTLKTKAFLKSESFLGFLGVPIQAKYSGFDFERRETIIVESKG
jgi:hypothetical protein